MSGTAPVEVGNAAAQAASAGVAIHLQMSLDKKSTDMPWFLTQLFLQPAQTSWHALLFLHQYPCGNISAVPFFFILQLPIRWCQKNMENVYACPVMLL